MVQHSAYARAGSPASQSPCPCGSINEQWYGWGINLRPDLEDESKASREGGSDAASPPKADGHVKRAAGVARLCTTR